MMTVSALPPKYPAARPGRNADQQNDHLHDDTDRQRDARAENQPDENIPAELIGAHRVLPSVGRWVIAL